MTGRMPAILRRISCRGGGSSSGSASSVACGLADFSLGTDSGGSIRVPASLCGVWGMRPSLHRISEAGVLPFMPSVSTVGAVAADLDILERAMRILLRSGTEPAADFALRPPPQFQIALIEVGQRRVQIRAPGVPQPLLTIERVAVLHRVIIDTESGRVVRLQTPPDFHRATLGDDVSLDDWKWSPDGRQFAFISTSRDHKEAVLHVADGESGLEPARIRASKPAMYKRATSYPGGPNKGPDLVSPMVLMELKPYFKCTVKIATSIEIIRGMLTRTTRAPTMIAKPPASSRSVTAHAVISGKGTPICSRSLPKPAGPRLHFAQP